MLQTKKKNITIRMLSITMAFVLCATILAGAPIKSYAAEPKKNVSVDDMKKSMEKVIKSVDDMKDMISPEKAEDLEQILSGFFNSAVSVGGSVIGVIDGASTFLQLIGVVKNANMKALADISEQLKLISDKLEVMDGKLDDIITQMTAMQAEGEFKDRTNRASDMNKYWVDFETEYMENQMDSLMREYEATLRDLAKIWIEDRNDDARHENAYEPMTNKVVILYDTMTGAARHTYMNNVDLMHKRDKVDNPDPYTIYADEFDTYAEGYLILNDT